MPAVDQALQQLFAKLGRPLPPALAKPEATAGAAAGTARQRGLLEAAVAPEEHSVMPDTRQAKWAGRRWYRRRTG